MRFNGTKSIPSLIGLLVIVGLITLLMSCGHPDNDRVTPPKCSQEQIDSKIKLGDDYVAVCDSYVVFCADKCKSSGFCYNDRYNVTLSLTAVCSSSFVIVVREGLIHEIKY